MRQLLLEARIDHVSIDMIMSGLQNALDLLFFSALQFFVYSVVTLKKTLWLQDNVAKKNLLLHGHLRAVAGWSCRTMARVSFVDEAEMIMPTSSSIAHTPFCFEEGSEESPQRNHGGTPRRMVIMERIQRPLPRPVPILKGTSKSSPDEPESLAASIRSLHVDNCSGISSRDSPTCTNSYALDKELRRSASVPVILQVCTPRGGYYDSRDRQRDKSVVKKSKVSMLRTATVTKTLSDPALLEFYSSSVDSDDTHHYRKGSSFVCKAQNFLLGKLMRPRTECVDNYTYVSPRSRMLHHAQGQDGNIIDIFWSIDKSHPLENLVIFFTS
jgi:hypothetical protein